MSRCAAAVWKRDTYRRTGRGPSGFEMHYERCRKWCWQHKDGTFLEFERATDAEE